MTSFQAVKQEASANAILKNPYHEWVDTCKSLKTITLVYLFAEHARLTILHIFSILLALNRSCSLNYFEEFFHPACLLHPAHLIAKVKMRHFLESKEQNMLI